MFGAGIARVAACRGAEGSSSRPGEVSSGHAALDGEGVIVRIRQGSRQTPHSSVRGTTGMELPRLRLSAGSVVQAARSAPSEQIEAAASEGLALQHHQLADLPPRLSAAPRGRQCGPHRRAVLLQSSGEGCHGGHTAAPRISEPAAERGDGCGRRRRSLRAKSPPNFTRASSSQLRPGNSFRPESANLAMPGGGTPFIRFCLTAYVVA